MSTTSKLVKLNFPAGVKRESTQYAEENSWYDVDMLVYMARSATTIDAVLLKNFDR